MTTKADREAAAVFHYRTKARALQDWIDSGVDPQHLVEPDIVDLADLLEKVRAEGARDERALHATADGGVTALIEIIDGLHKKLCAATDKIAELQLPPVTPQP